MRNHASTLLLALLLVPAAAAEYYEGKPECPEDMFCTMTESAPEDGAAAAPAQGSPVGLATLATLGVLAGVLAVRRR